MDIIDADSHLYEPRDCWADRIDPASRPDAVAIEDDELGYAWVTWRGERIHLAEVQHPGRIAELGEQRNRHRAGRPAEVRCDELLPVAYTDPGSRVGWLDEHGLDGSVLFPNHGLLWEGTLNADVPALTANLAAYNRWAAEVAQEGGGRLFPVAHLTLRDRDWVIGELKRLGEAGIKMAMVAPSPVDDVPLHDASLDPVWAAFAEHDVAVTFHVGAHRRPLDPVWYRDDTDPVNSLLDTVLLWVAPAAGLTDLIVYGVLERHPSLRIAVIELTAHWVPQWLLMLDGGMGFFNTLMGRPPVELPHAYSDYFRRQVRVGALAYEQPARLVTDVGEDTFMFGSDWPHAEGIADPLGTYEAANPGIAGRAREQLYGGNVRWLLGLPS